MVKISNNGDIVHWSPEVCNTGNETCVGTRAKLTIPEGVKLVYRGINQVQTPTYNKGIFNLQELTWYLGDVKPSECFKIDFEFEIIDKSLGDFTIGFCASSSCIEDLSDNVQNLLISVVEDCNIADVGIGPEDCETIVIKI